MKVLIATGIFPPDIGGPATYLPQLIELLKKDNHQVTVITFSDYADSEQTGNHYKVIRIRRQQNKLVKIIKYAAALLRNLKQADWVYLNDITSSGLAFLLANKFWRKKFIVRIAGDSNWEYAYQARLTNKEPLTFKEPALPWGLKRRISMATRICQLADFIIVPSSYLKGVVEKWDIKPEKIIVLYNAVDYSAIDQLFNSTAKDDESLRKILEKKRQGQKIFLGCGRLIRLKNFDCLIKTFKQVPNGLLVIVGEGPEESSLKKQIDALNLNQQVLLVPKIERNRLLGLFKQTDAFILLSKIETFSFTALEALASGTRLIVSKGGALPEIFGEWEHRGVEFVELTAEDKLTNLLNKIETMPSINQQGIEQLKQKYNWQEHYQGLMRVIDKL